MESPLAEKSTNHVHLHGYYQTSNASINAKKCIDDPLHFDNVPELAWNFYFTGYQSAPKNGSKAEKAINYTLRTF
ncbi:MAG: hypothetical protein ACKVOU_13385 [Cytophagales bacterium]